MARTRSGLARSLRCPQRLAAWRALLATMALALVLAACATSPDGKPTLDANPAPAVAPNDATTGAGSEQSEAPLPTVEAPATVEPAAQVDERQVDEAESAWPVCFELIADERLRTDAYRLYERGEHESFVEQLSARRGAAGADAQAVDLCLAMAHLVDGDLAAGVSLLLPWAELAGPLQHQTLAMLADAYEQAGQWQPASNVYSMLLALDPPAQEQVLWRAARANVQAGDESQALRRLQQIDTALLTAAFRAQVLEELARLARMSNQWELALAALDEIQSFAVQPAYRMMIEVERARTLLSIGDDETALAILRQAMVEYPDQVAGQQALLVLRELAAEGEEDDDDAKPVSLVEPLIEARVLYHSHQNEAAEDAIKAALKTRDADRAEAYALRGLISAARGQPRSALAELDRAITLYSQRGQLEDAVTQRRIAEVWFAKADVVKQNNGDPSKVYTLFASRYGRHPDAPQALQLAARYLAASEQPGRAADLYARIAAEYPDSAMAEEAGLYAGLLYYQNADPERARTVWASELQRLEAGAADESRARILVWTGLALRDTGDLLGAGEAWKQATTLAPDSYWGVRATDLMAGTSLRLGLEAAMPAASPPTAWDAVEDWVSSWALSSEVDLREQVSGGLWMWRVGWQSDAVSRLYALATQERSNAPLLLYMARESEVAGCRYIASVAAEYLIREGQQRQADAAPDDLWRVAYPMAYPELVAEYAERYGIDPLLFTALIRQESRFYARAVSSAGARGLTQVMPATGKWIAESIGPEDYRETLLTRPYLNLRYGAWYLNFGLGLRGRDWPAALVAYNAGPGSLDLLTEGREIVDYDLFVETLAYSETKAYVTGVYRQYRIYERLYR